MRLLIIGGTRFVGLAITKEAISRGHTVTVFHRGSTRKGLEGVEHIIGDRDSDLSGLADESLSWDATIDVCAYRPGQVDSLANVLGDRRGGKYVYISTVSVFAEDVDLHANEEGKKVDLSPLEGLDCSTCPIDSKTYGPLKLLCEQRVLARFHENKPLIIRPTYVVGPEDYTMRFPKWVQKISDGGVIDCPNPRENPFQFIDARDQAIFICDLIERGDTLTPSLTFNSCISPEITFGELLESIARSVGPPGTTLNWIDVPLDIPAPDVTAKYTLWSRKASSIMAIDSSAAVANGLKFRPLSETIADTLAWLQTTKEQ